MPQTAAATAALQKLHLIQLHLWEICKRGHAQRERDGERAAAGQLAMPEGKKRVGEDKERGLGECRDPLSPPCANPLQLFTYTRTHKLSTPPPASVKAQVAQ